jgi:beta-glucanase (GH16 family)
MPIVIVPEPRPMPGPVNTGPGDVGPPPPIPGLWTLVFDDEFNAATVSSAWVNKIWGLTQVPGDAETYSPSAVATANGVVSLTASNQQLNGRSYTSGVLTTGGIPGRTAPGFSFTYGYVEARIKMAPGNGMWSAFWMLPTPYADGTIHDDDGELDVVEFVGPEPTVGNAAAHRGGVNHVHDYDLGTDLTQGFHTYGLDWEPDHLTWYVDGNVVFTTTDTAVIPTVAEYLILNLSVGVAGSWPGTPDATTSFPTSMQVDYVHVWQKGG